jgi:hypothetical protein
MAMAMIVEQRQQNATAGAYLQSNLLTQQASCITHWALPKTLQAGTGDIIHLAGAAQM